MEATPVASAPAILLRVYRTVRFDFVFPYRRGPSGRAIHEESDRAAVVARLTATDSVVVPTGGAFLVDRNGPFLRKYRAQLSSRGVTECRRAG